MLKKKEAHPVDAKSLNKPIKELEKKQENTLLQEPQGSNL
jgi:hypothetical protein